MFKNFNKSKIAILAAITLTAATNNNLSANKKYKTLKNHQVPSTPMYQPQLAHPVYAQPTQPVHSQSTQPHVGQPLYPQQLPQPAYSAQVAEQAIDYGDISSHYPDIISNLHCNTCMRTTITTQSNSPLTPIILTQILHQYSKESQNAVLENIANLYNGKRYITAHYTASNPSLLMQQLYTIQSQQGLQQFLRGQQLLVVQNTGAGCWLFAFLDGKIICIEFTTTPRHVMHDIDFSNVLTNILLALNFTYKSATTHSSHEHSIAKEIFKYLTLQYFFAHLVQKIRLAIAKTRFKISHFFLKQRVDLEKHKIQRASYDYLSTQMQKVSV